MVDISHLADHRVRFWRETSSKEDGFRREVRSWSVLGGPTEAAVQHRNQAISNVGPGEAIVGSWKVYLDLPGSYRPATGDLVQVVSGPNAPKVVKIEDDYAPRGEFLQLTCSAWHGTLPES